MVSQRKALVVIDKEMYEQCQQTLLLLFLGKEPVLVVLFPYTYEYTPQTT